MRDLFRHLRWDQNLTTIDTQPPRSFICQSLRTENRKSGVGRRPFNVFDICEKMRIYIINADLWDLIVGCSIGYRLSHRSIRSLEGQTFCLFEYRRHDDLEVGFRILTTTVDLLLIRLIENLRT